MRLGFFLTAAVSAIAAMGALSPPRETAATATATPTATTTITIRKSAPSRAGAKPRR